MALVNKTFSDIITFTRASTATFSNLATYSEQFDNVAGWTPTRSSVSANATTAPTGTNVADKLVEDTTASNTHYDQTAVITPTAATSYTFSAYFKASERTQCGIGLTGAGNSDSIVVFNLSTGAYVATVGAAPSSYSITPAGSGWYRCSITWVTTSTAAMAGRVYTANASTITYTGDGTSGLFLFGAQVEAGAFPTSYIPTTTTALTRAADVASVNTLSPWWNASEGTFYVEGSCGSLANSPIFVMPHDGTSNNYLNAPLLTTAGLGRLAGVVGGAAWTNVNTANSTTANTTFKSAYALKASDQAICLNAGTVATGTNASVPVVTTVKLGDWRTSGNSINGYLRRVTYYPTRLSNAQLQAITA